jgi:predicted dinucleotide-binding enzyme
MLAHLVSYRPVCFDLSTVAAMRIAILGNGGVAVALGGVWVAAGHDVVLAGRSSGRAATAAAGIGASSAPVASAVAGRDAVLLAVPWAGVEPMLREAGALAGAVVIDPTNAVTHGVGELLVPSGTSAAERIAELAPGALVVKAFHLVPAEAWPAALTVPLAGDDAGALETVSTLVRDVGGTPHVFGGLSRARQLEEAAGFFIGLAFAGVDPRATFPAL